VPWLPALLGYGFRAVSLLLIGQALWAVWRGRAADLVETRARTRVALALVSGVAIALITVEAVVSGPAFARPPLLKLGEGAALFLLNLALGLALLRLEPDFVPTPPQSAAAAATPIANMAVAPPPAGPAEDQDAEVLARLKGLMERERAWRETGLAIGGLAARVGVHRLREAMRDGTLAPLGGEGKTAEIDESYVGGKDKNRHARKRKHLHGTLGKEPVFSLVERGGKVRSFHLPDVKGDTLRGIVKAHLDGKTVVYTDNNHTTQFAVKGFKTDVVNHSLGEYVRGDAHTNTMESYFSIMKRGIIGTYRHVSQQHLKRYLAEFDFRHNERAVLGVDDATRAARVLGGIVGKRLTYRDSSGARVPQE
jgi:hypothetical protein